MRATRGMRLVLGMFIVLGAVASFGVGVAVAGTPAGNCGLECRLDCGEGECEEFESTGCGCVWLCADGTGGEIVCG